MPIATDEKMPKTRYGNLSVLYFLERKRYGKENKYVYIDYYRCRCDCGRECDASLSLMRRGLKVNCGCTGREAIRRSKIIDLSGQRFGRLLVKSLDGPGKRGAIWNCVCDCGTEKKMVSADLVHGGVVSCGCYKRAVNGQTSRTHGMSSTATYKIWQGMHKRCNNPKCRTYPLYGGRGIKVCERWESFENFLEDMGERPADNLSLDRIDNEGDYEPGNCRWATDTEQVNNTRRNNRITFNGVTQNLGQWAKQTGLPRDAIFLRIKRGWSVERALTTPLRPGGNTKADVSAFRSPASYPDRPRDLG